MYEYPIVRRYLFYSVVEFRAEIVREGDPVYFVGYGSECVEGLPEESGGDAG